MEADSPLPNSKKKKNGSDSAVKQSRSAVPRQLLRILKQSVCPIYFLDANDRILFANQALHECLGLERDYLVGLECSSHAVARDEQIIQLASELTVSTNSRREAIHVEPLISSQARGNYSAKLVMPMNSERQDGSVMVIWLKPADPLWKLANDSLDWAHQQVVFHALVAGFQGQAKGESHLALTGTSPGTRQLKQQFQAAADGNMPVCIYGPSGSSKVQLAKLIHRNRSRSQSSTQDFEPPLIIDCRLMDQGLLESMIELTEERHGDDRSRSQTPTLLLIQIEQLPEETHQCLADYLQRRRPPTLVTAACEPLVMAFPQSHTWRSIVAAVDVFSLRIQALADRLEDILLCADSQVEQIQRGTPTNLRKTLSPNSRRLLQAYPWPDNLDELTASIEFAIKNCNSLLLEPEHFPMAIQTFASHILKPKAVEPIELDRAMEAFERRLFEQAIAAFPKNRAAAARHLGISRTRFLRRLAQLGFEPETSQDEELSKPKGEKTADSKSGSSPPEADAGSHDPDLPVFEEIQD
jgi:DNA-binding NtrC family response regulator